MTPAEIDGNGVETQRNEEIAGTLKHIDEMTHEILRRVTALEAFVDEHRPALARGLSLMDGGAAVRRFMGGGRRAVREDRTRQVPES